MPSLGKQFVPTETDKLYSLFFTTMINKDFLLPHQKEFLNIESMEI